MSVFLKRAKWACASNHGRDTELKIALSNPLCEGLEKGQTKPIIKTMTMEYGATTARSRANP